MQDGWEEIDGKQDIRICHQDVVIDQFKLTKSEVRDIRDLAIFAVMFHLRPIRIIIDLPPIEAPLNDFQL